MAVADSTIELLADMLAPMGQITSKRMFSGAGIYCNGIIFALHLRDTLYFKADAASIPAFEAEGKAPFSYDTATGSRTITSYWQVPERLFDEPDEMIEWARRALAVSIAAPTKKKRGGGRKRDKAK